MPAPTQASIVVKKEFTFRGSDAIFSNRYYTDLTSWPTSETFFEDCADAIVSAEEPLFGSDVTIAEVLFYNGGSDLSVFDKTFTTTGTLDTSSANQCPGDCAAMARYSTTARSTKNKPIYLYNWYHGAYQSSGGSPDTLLTAQKTAIEDYAALWVAGFTIDSTTFHRASPRGAAAQQSTVGGFIRHRDFPGA